MFYSFDLKTNHDIHLHNIRQRHNRHITRVKHEFAKRFIRYQLPSEINLTPTLITDKINTHSFNGFSNYAKTYMISKYWIVLFAITYAILAKIFYLNCY